MILSQSWNGNELRMQAFSIVIHASKEKTFTSKVLHLGGTNNVIILHIWQLTHEMNASKQFNNPSFNM